MPELDDQNNPLALDAIKQLQVLGVIPTPPPPQANQVGYGLNERPSGPVSTPTLLSSNTEQKDLNNPLASDKPALPTTQSPNATSQSPSNDEIEFTGLEPPVVKPDTTNNIPAFGDTGGVNKAYNAANASEANAEYEAAQKKFEAERFHQTQKNENNVQYLDDYGKLNQQYSLDRDMAIKKAQDDNVIWAKEMDAEAAKRPDPGAWWHNHSTFGKVMWALAIAFDAKAVSLGAKSTIMELIQRNIKEDIAEQKEVISRQLANKKLKGTQREKDLEVQLKNLNDDHSQNIQRLNAILQANNVKAETLGDSDLKSKYAEINAGIEARKTAVASDRLKNVLTERLHLVDQGYDTKKQQLEFRHQSTEKALDRDLSRDLANMSLAGKLAVAEDKAKRKQDLHEFPIQSGIKVTIPAKNGQPAKDATFAVPKDQANTAGEIARGGQSRIVLTQALIDSIESGGLPYGLASDNTEARKALSALVDPTLKQFGGRFGAQNYKAMQEYVIGEDASSLVQRMKGHSKEEIIQLLRNDIKEIPGATKQALLGIPGTNLADDPDMQLVFTSPDTRGPKSVDRSAEEKIESATGIPPAPIKLKNDKEVKEYGGDAEKAMPSDLRDVVDDAKAKLSGGFDQASVDTVLNKSIKNILAWQNSVNNKDPVVTDHVNNASILVKDAATKAYLLANKLPEIKAILEANAMSGKPVDSSDVKKKVKEAGLTLSIDRIKSIVDEINSKNPFNKLKE